MVLETYPPGLAALHPDWPEAQFNISAAFEAHGLVCRFLDMVRQGFGCRVPIESMHGAPAMLWNGGRVTDVVYEPGKFKAMLAVLEGAGVGYCPTFTSHLIEEADLGDPAGNAMLEAIARRPELHGVILTSDRLSAYIARRYPKLRQIASVVKVVLENGQGRVDYYRELGRRFHRYVVHPDDSRDLKLMEQLERQKVEILLNENCVANCGNRARHYDVTARLQRANCQENAVAGAPPEPGSKRAGIMAEMAAIKTGCWMPLRQMGMASGRRSCNLSSVETKAIYDLGFRHFKLQGRAGSPFNYLYDLARFTLEPEHVAPIVCKRLFCILHGTDN